MSEQRIANFAAGPGVLPEAVLETAAKEMLNYQGSGMSVMEMSHRSKVYDGIITETVATLKRVMNIPDNYKVLLLQGGATMQFSAIPLNLLKTKADYILTGYFSNNAYKEAKKYGEVNVAASSSEDNFSYIPKQEDLKLSSDADYLYICANNTIYGTEYKYVPETTATLVADMSSNILSKPVDVSRYGIIYAGAQKNMGPAGLTVVIVRDDLLGNFRENSPVLLDYKLMADKDSMYNTPPTFAIYMLGLVLKWVENLGGLEAMEKINIEKAALLYDYLDSSKLFKGTANKADRSLMNVCFRTGDEDLDAKFVKEMTAKGFVNLKGHRAVGGMRASIYNAQPIENVKALVEYMRKFEAENV